LNFFSCQANPAFFPPSPPLEKVIKTRCYSSKKQQNLPEYKLNINNKNHFRVKNSKNGQRPGNRPASIGLSPSGWDFGGFFMETTRSVENMA
jgi:hypothetical protein